jgi:glycerol-3-phosphate dehydrogenase
MADSPRLLVEMLRWAVSCGAGALNYVEVSEVLRDGATVRGVRARDRVGGTDLEYRASAVVNCGGPWCRELAARFDRERPDLFRASLAFNVWIDREPPAAEAVAVDSKRDGRTYFLHPFKGRVLAGTFHAPWTGGPAAGVDEPLLDRFLADLAESIRGFDVGRADVLRVLAGLLPARRDGSIHLANREVVLHHGDDAGPAGLWSVSGVKWTTARAVAEKTLRKLVGWRGTSLPAYRDLRRPAPAAPPPAKPYRALLAADPRTAIDLARRIVADESVVALDDLLCRRTDWGLDPADERDLGPRLAGVVPIAGPAVAGHSG